MGVCSSKPATKDAPVQQLQTQAPVPPSPAQASPSPRRATIEQKEAVAGATEQAKDAVQQAGEQVQTRVKELERMQQEIERLKEAPVSLSEDAHNQLRIQQLEREVLQVQQEINVTLEIAEQEIKEASSFSSARVQCCLFQSDRYSQRGSLIMQAVLSAQASFKQDDGAGHAGQTSQVPVQIATPQLQANGPTGGYTSAPMLQDTANVDGTAGSTGAYSHNPHAAMADETISLDSPSHSIGASRAALAGSSFADSDISAEHRAAGFHEPDLLDSPQGYGTANTGFASSSQAPATAANAASHIAGDSMAGTHPTSRHGTSSAQPITGNSIYGIQLSSKPILGGEGTFSTQPVTQPWQYATATAGSDNPQHESQNRHADDGTAIDVGRSTFGTKALEAGRAEMLAHPEPQAERSLRSTYSTGRDSPAFQSDSPSHSSAQGQSCHQSVSEAPSQCRDSGQAEDDGQAEGLVTDVQSRAQEASQSGVIAGQEQQQKAHHAAAAYKKPAAARSPASPTPVPNSAPGKHASPGSSLGTDGPSTSVGFPPMTTITSPRGGEYVGGAEIDWGRVQEIQKQAMLAGQEAMEQSRKGLMDVKEAIQRRTQMQ
ncbi:TPA: hypothetical protein ACH3X1_000902 [Trebouxia sp. C0004]